MEHFFVAVALPLTLAFIMFTLGLGLRIADFMRVFQFPRAFFTGFVNQVMLLPLVGISLAIVFDLPPELAVGMVILCLSPGAAATNVLTRLAHGNVPLSISLTAVVTTLSVVTVPLIAGWAVAYFMEGRTVSGFDTTALSIRMVLMTLLPVSLGMILTAAAPAFVERNTGILSSVAVGLFALIIVAAIATNFGVVSANFAAMGPPIAILVVVMLSLGLVSGRITGLSPSDATTISIESGIQNGTLGVAVGAAVAAQILDGSSGISGFAVPSAVYSVVMYVFAIPFVFWRRRRAEEHGEAVTN